ncbi:MAG: YybH family protein [Burkholderiales bacterium]
MPRPLFTSPQDAEAAFYEAFEKADLEAMMAVWADDDDIVCIHPGASRLTGVEAVRESWRQIFGSGQRLSLRLRELHRMQAMMVAVHSLFEHIAVAGDNRPRTAVVATNIYQQTERGWRLVMHHASPAPGTPGPGTPAPGTPGTLH